MALGNDSRPVAPATAPHGAKSGHQRRPSPLTLHPLPPEVDEEPAYAGDPVLGWSNAEQGVEDEWVSRWAPWG